MVIKHIIISTTRNHIQNIKIILITYKILLGVYQEIFNVIISSSLKSDLGEANVIIHQFSLILREVEVEMRGKGKFYWRIHRRT